jgi:iron complex transport system permease protein
LALLPLVAFALALLVGRYPISPVTVLRAFRSYLLPGSVPIPAPARTIILQVRLPRALLAAGVGASLSVSGAAFQGMFQNPLVSPELLGVSGGAGFGAVLMILLSGDSFAIQLAAFVFGLVAVAATYSISRIYRSAPLLMLVLSGIVVGSVFSALISLVTYTADPHQKLPAIVFWLLGSLSTASQRDVYTTLPVMALGAVGLMAMRWRLNVISMGDQQASSLGIDVEASKRIIIICATLVSAAAVSVSGLVGWVGLVIPHLARMLVGPDHRRLLPAAIALGATYLLIVDGLARALTSAEIPLGIITALVGAPFFAILIRRTRGGWYV